MKRRKKRAHRDKSPLLFEGNVWVMPSAAAATQVYQALLQQFLDKNPDEWSLVSGFFQQ